MHSFRGGFLDRFTLPLGSVWLLTDIAEAKGKQALSTRQAPQVLAALRETALVQSVESSNRIEGVTVAPDRLVPLVLEDARPRRVDYYDVLRRSSIGWHEGRHDLLPWLNYFLSVLRRAYRELETHSLRVEGTS
jgi:hypothetical protein